MEQAMEAIKANIDGSVDAIWLGCGLRSDIKEENMHALVKTAMEYGRKPSLGGVQV